MYFVNLTNSDLTDGTITRLARKLSSKEMKKVASDHFKLTNAEVKNMKTDPQKDPIDFNIELLTVWKNKNYGENQVQVNSSKK